MASNYLGPETPRPFAVISEQFRNKLLLPGQSDVDPWSLGAHYEDGLIKGLFKHLEPFTTDDLCYIGQPRGNIIRLLQNRLGLLNDITHISPVAEETDEQTSEDTADSANQSVTASSHFSDLSKLLPNESRRYDRILMYHCAHLTTKRARLFKQMLSSLREGGKLVLVHRAWELATLPVYNSAEQKLRQSRPSYTSFLEELQSSGYDVSWELESLPVVINKRQWLQLLREHFPPELEHIPEQEMSQGLRELTERALKYQGEVITFTDRLLFVSASPPPPEHSPVMRRHGQLPWTPLSILGAVRCSMEVTGEIRTILDEQEVERRRKRKLTERVKRIR